VIYLLLEGKLDICKVLGDMLVFPGRLDICRNMNVLRKSY